MTKKGILKRVNARLAAIAAFAFILVLCLVTVTLLGACKKKSSGNEVFEYGYKTNSLVGYSAQVLGTVQRYKPVKEIRDGNLPSGYPKYGVTLSGVIGSDADKVAARDALIAESSYLTATGTSNAGGGNYLWMDKDGYLYNGTTAEPIETVDKYTNQKRQLYKHTAAVGLYLGDVADDEPGLVKQVTMRPRGYNSYGITGLYAPAGEVIKIQISEADMDATGGIIIHIGQALYNGQANNIWTAKGQMQRIPHLLNTMVVNKNTATLENGVYTAYVGSFIGGPIYIRNEAVTFSATISGGVAYSHFILGYTTPEEFEENSKSSAPYFDLEVWQTGVLHSGPVTYAKAFSYDDLYQAAVLWDKVSGVAITNGSSQGIVFLYDPFVAAGAAVAFPGRSSVNCPMGWMSSSLNYKSIITSGSWGNFHEYHHNFQNFGAGYTGEVTNNALTLVSYSLFTKISSARQLPAYGAQGLGGWNNYTSATWTTAMVNTNNINSTSGLAVYATLLHNFGQDAFISARGYSGVNYLNRWADITHQDFSYFASKVTLWAGEDFSKNANFKQNDYPMFVPVASVYQTGRSYMYDDEKRNIETMQPYVIPYGQKFTVDLNPYTLNAANQYESGSIVIGNGFKYNIKSINTSELKGTFVETAEKGIYTFTPIDSEMRSGKIYVTLEITTEDGSKTYNGKALDDVDLILEFEQSHETNKMTLERTTYTYTADTMITDARQAYETNFGSYQSVETIDHTNPTQNCNTDIWYYPDTQANRDKYPNAPEHYFVHENTISVVEGKLYFQEDGKYRIYMRGRTNCAFYYSLDGKTYELGGYIADNNTSAAFRPGAENTYVDITLNEAGSWVYFKEILINRMVNNSQASYIGLGVGTWSDPLFRMVEKYYDKNGNEVSSTEDPNYDHSITYYYDSTGRPVPEEEVVAAEKVPPTNASYVNAYRADYEFPSGEYIADYFYPKKINLSYAGDPQESSTWDEGAKLFATNVKGENSTYEIDKIFEADTTTYLHTGGNGGKNVYITLDMGRTVTANTIIFLGRTDRAANTSQQGLPSVFSIQVSDDGTNYTDAGTYNNPKGAAYSASVNLDNAYTFRYINIIVENTHSNTGRLILSGINFTYTFRLTGNGDNVIEPDNDGLVYRGNWQVVSTHSSFGHVYVGQKNSTLTFEFEGTRLAILSSYLYEKNFEVTIDGKKVGSEELKAYTSGLYVSYISELLSEGKHTVVVTGTGEFTIDSIATY